MKNKTIANKEKKPTTVTEIMLIEQAKHSAKMNYLMAKALVEGKVTSTVLRWAEMIVQSEKEIFGDK